MGCATFCRCSTRRATAMSMPRLTSTGLAPSPMARTPSRTMAWAMTVAVVVPSPTMSLVLIAASLTSCAPMFSNWSLRWISRAIVTPSLVTTGEPVIFSRIALRPLGPSVDLTASASWSTPARSRARASAPKRSSLAIGFSLVVSKLRDEDGPAADPAGVQVGERVGGGVQRVGPGVQGHPAALRQGHQLGEVVVGAHDVPDDVALGGDDVERGDLHGAAVADDEVGAAAAGHGPPVGLGALLGDEVEHDLRAAAAGQLPDRLDLPAVGHHGVVRADLAGQLQRVGVAVHHDDRGGGERGQALDTDMAQAPRPYHDGRRARVQQADGLAYRMVGGDAGVSECRNLSRPGLRVELHAGARRGEQVLGHPAVVGQAGERVVGAVHVVAGPAGPAQPAGRGRVQDHGVADGHVGDRRADLVYPAGVLVAERVGQRGVHRGVPLPLDDVQVGPADAGPADLHDDVQRALDARLGHLVDDGMGVVTMDPDSLHGAFLSCSWACPRPAEPYRCRSMPRQMLLFASMPMRVALARRRCTGAASSRIRSPVAGSISSGAPGPAGRPSSARRCRSRSSAADAGTSPRVIASRVSRVAPAASNGRHTWSVPAITALRRKSARSPCSSLTASPSNDAAKPAWAATPPLIASEAKWSSRTTTVLRTPGTALTAS